MKEKTTPCTCHVCGREFDLVTPLGMNSGTFTKSGRQITTCTVETIKDGKLNIILVHPVETVRASYKFGGFYRKPITLEVKL